MGGHAIEYAKVTWFALKVESGAVPTARHTTIQGDEKLNSMHIHKFYQLFEISNNSAEGRTKESNLASFLMNCTV